MEETNSYISKDTFGENLGDYPDFPKGTVQWDIPISEGTIHLISSDYGLVLPLRVAYLEQGDVEKIKNFLQNYGDYILKYESCVDILQHCGGIGNYAAQFIVKEDLEYLVNVPEALKEKVHEPYIEGFKFMLNDINVQQKKEFEKLKLLALNKQKKDKRASIEGFIYLAKDSSPYTKIGWSKNPAVRERQLAIGNATIRMHKTFKTVQKYDSLIKDMFKDKHIQGEWYNLSDVDIQKIAKVLSE